jgi:hypothetical protein
VSEDRPGSRARQLIAVGLVSMLVLEPLLARAGHDRRQAAALLVRADVHRAVTRALGGESYVSIDVEAPMPWHVGRVILSAPAGWECLIEHVAADALASMPRAYELVLRSGGRPAAAPNRPRARPAAA